MREDVSDKEYGTSKGPEVGDVMVVQDSLVCVGGSRGGGR